MPYSTGRIRCLEEEADSNSKSLRANLLWADVPLSGQLKGFAKIHITTFKALKASVNMMNMCWQLFLDGLPPLVPTFS